MYRCLTIGFFLFVPLILSAQKEYTSLHFDSLTYKQYQAQDWKNLQKSGRQALHKGYDYYYMRMRLGIAYYERRKYRKAVSQFYHALQFNSLDKIPWEYLYFSYLYSGRYADLSLFTPYTPPSFRKNYSIRTEPGLNHFNLYYQFSMNENTHIDEEFEAPSLTEISEEGMQFLTRYYNYFSAGLGHALSPGIQLQQNFAYIYKQDLYYYTDLTDEYLIPNRYTGQYQYFIKARMHLFHGSYLAPSFHFLYVKSPAIYVRQGTGFSSVKIPAFENSEFVFHLAFNQELDNFNFELGTCYAFINETNHWQQNAQLIWYPLSNLNLYLIGAGSYVSEGSFLSTENSHWVFRGKAGWKTTSFLWTELFGYAGNMKNYVDNQGLSVYNSLDRLENLFGLHFIIYLNSGTSFDLGYTYALLNSRFENYPESGTGSINLYNYYVHTLNGGIQWNF